MIKIKFDVIKQIAEKTGENQEGEPYRIREMLIQVKEEKPYQMNVTYYGDKDFHKDKTYIGNVSISCREYQEKYYNRIKLVNFNEEVPENTVINNVSKVETATETKVFTEKSPATDDELDQIFGKAK